MIFAFRIGFLEIDWIDVVDVLLVSGLLYHLFRLAKGKLAVRIFAGFILLYLVYMIVQAARMELLSTVLEQFAGIGVLALVILFQQEIRRFLFLLGRTTTMSRHNQLVRNMLVFFGKQDNRQTLNISEVLSAVETMAEERTGALIVISRGSSFETLVEIGDRLDARLSKRLLLAIFNKLGPMHDGAVIIYENRIVAARCILPISETSDIHPQFGTRHRAAVGIAERSDVFVIVVSEETGRISAVHEGKIFPNISIQNLRKFIQDYSENTPIKAPTK